MNCYDRLLLCADLLEDWHRRLERKRAGEPDLGTVPRHDQSIWGEQAPECGTACCAWGYLAMRPEIQALGVSHEWARLDDSPDERLVMHVHYDGAAAYSGIALFFGSGDSPSLWVTSVFGVDHDLNPSEIASCLRERAAFEN